LKNRTAIAVFVEVIEYESNNVKKLFFEGKVTKLIKNQAKVICKKLISFGLNRYEYKQIDGNIVNINTETRILFL